MVPVVSRAAEGWAAVVSRFPCLRGRGPPRGESRLACIPITAFRLSPASTLRAAPHAIDRHSYRNAYADCSSSWWPHPAPAPAASRRPPPSRPAAGHADLIRLEAAFRRAGQWSRIRTRAAQLRRSGPVRRGAGNQSCSLWPTFRQSSRPQPGNSPCRHKGSPFLHFALPDPAPDRKHQPLPDRRGLSSMALVDRGLSTPPAMTGGAAHHPQSHGQPGRTASPAPPRTGPSLSCQRGGSGLRPVSAPVGALRHLPAALPVRQTVPSPARHWHGCPLPLVDTLRSAPPTSWHPRRQRHRSIPEPETGSHPARQKAGDCYGRHTYAILAEDQLTA